MKRILAILATLVLALGAAGAVATSAHADYSWCPQPTAAYAPSGAACQTVYTPSGSYLHVGNAMQWLAQVYFRAPGCPAPNCYDMYSWTANQLGAWNRYTLYQSPTVYYSRNTSNSVNVEAYTYAPGNRTFCYWYATVQGGDGSMGLGSTISSGCGGY